MSQTTQPPPTYVITSAHCNVFAHTPSFLAAMRQDPPYPPRQGPVDMLMASAFAPIARPVATEQALGMNSTKAAPNSSSNPSSTNDNSVSATTIATSMDYPHGQPMIQFRSADRGLEITPTPSLLQHVSLAPFKVAGKIPTPCLKLKRNRSIESGEGQTTTEAAEDHSDSGPAGTLVLSECECTSIELNRLSKLAASRRFHRL